MRWTEAAIVVGILLAVSGVVIANLLWCNRHRETPVRGRGDDPLVEQDYETW